MESYLFTEYGKKKLHSISNTYRELSFVYQDSKPDYVAKTRQQRLQQMELQTTKKAFARNLQELSVAVEDVVLGIVLDALGIPLNSFIELFLLQKLVAFVFALKSLGSTLIKISSTRHCV